jgi:hypothetical protein
MRELGDLSEDKISVPWPSDACGGIYGEHATALSAMPHVPSSIPADEGG